MIPLEVASCELEDHIQLVTGEFIRRPKSCRRRIPIIGELALVESQADDLLLEHIPDELSDQFGGASIAPLIFGQILPIR